MKTNENYEFGISKIFLDKMFYSNTDKYEKWLVKIGGVVGLTNLLRTDLKKGISELEKTNIFLRKKVLDKWNLSKKITINDYHVYSIKFDKYEKSITVNVENNLIYKYIDPYYAATNSTFISISKSNLVHVFRYIK